MFRKIFIILTAFILCTVLASCDESDSGTLTQPPYTAPEPTTISISYGLNPTLTFEAGESRMVCFKVEGDDPVLSNDLIALIGDEDIIEVEYYDSSAKYFYYRVTAINSGSTTLTIKHVDTDATSETVSIKVVKPGPSSAVITDSIMTHINTYVGDIKNIYVKIVGSEMYTSEEIELVISSEGLLSSEYVDATDSYLHYKLTALEAGKVTLYVASKSGDKISDEITVEIHASSTDADDGEIAYIANTSSMRYHVEGCSYTSQMNPSHILEGKTKEWLEENKYTPCEKCNP
ncbi:MAG: hypothetical protein IJX92_02565 [Clostridia bacterium]|nr:hypothetical protein [Clostridia bacterium]